MRPSITLRGFMGKSVRIGIVGAGIAATGQTGFSHAI
jgi:hypothetical protein